MPILVTISKLANNGTCQTAMSMSRSLLAVGHQIILAYDDSRDLKDNPAILKEWQESGVELLPISGMSKSVNLLGRRRMLKEFEARHAMDPIEMILVFDQQDRGTALWLADRMAERGKIPCVLWAESPHEFHGPFNDWQESSFSELLTRHLGMAICTSQLASLDFANRFGIVTEKIEEIPVPVELPARHKIDESERLRLRSQWSAGEDDFIWVNPSQLSFENGQDLLLEALISVHRQFGTARLILMDQGPEQRTAEEYEFRNTLRQRIEDERLGRTVFILEPSENTADVQSVCDGTILTQRHTTQSQHREILASLASEIPTVMTENAEVCKLIENGQDARIVASDSVDSIRQAMVDLMNASSGERKWMGTGGHAVVAEHFDAEKIRRRFLASVEQVLSKSPVELRRTS